MRKTARKNRPARGAPPANGDASQSFSARLKDLCRMAGIESPTDLAERLDQLSGTGKDRAELSVGGPAGWWNGTRSPSIENIERILRITGGDGHWLLTGEGHAFRIERSAQERAFSEIAQIVDTARRPRGG